MIKDNLLAQHIHPCTLHTQDSLPQPLIHVNSLHLSDIDYVRGSGYLPSSFH